MKKTRKTLLVTLCALLLVATSILGTLAYLTSQDTVTNTFTVGSVEITLDETEVNLYGEPTDGGVTRVKANTYKLLPGHEYVKDPIVHVNAASEPCYIRAIVTVDDIDQLQAAFPKTSNVPNATTYPEFYLGDVFLLEKLVTGWNNAVWAIQPVTDNQYEFRYVGPSTDDKGVYTYTEANKDLPALFETIVMPNTLDAEHLAKLADAKITVVAHAIQADGFADADAAWAAFDQ